MYVKKGLPMARKSPEEAARTRRALIAAGVDHFAERGYAGAALEELLTTLGLTRGALYHHFGNKRGFFDAVVEEVQRELGKRILSAAERAGDGWAGIEAGCDAFLGAASDPVYRRIVIVDAPAALGWERWKELDDAYLTSTLAEGLEALEIEDPEATAVALSGAMNELAQWVAHHGKPRSALKRARAATRAFLSAAREGG